MCNNGSYEPLAVKWPNFLSLALNATTPLGPSHRTIKEAPLYEGLLLYSKDSFRARIDVTSAQVSLRWKKQIQSLSSRTIHDFTKGLNDVSLERFNIIVPHCCEHCNQHMSDDSRPGPNYVVIFLGKTHYCYNVSLHPGTWMIKHYQISIFRWRAAVLHVASFKGNWEKLWQLWATAHKP